METSRGRIKAISISRRRGTKKDNVPRADLEAGRGIPGDAHAGDWHRQVSLLGAESIEKMIEKGVEVAPGDFAENVTTEGVDLGGLSVGERLRLGENAELEITQIGKECHDRCEIYGKVGDCVMPREGVFAKVVASGRIEVEDVIEVLDD